MLIDVFRRYQKQILLANDYMEALLFINNKQWELLSITFINGTRPSRCFQRDYNQSLRTDRNDVLYGNEQLGSR